MDPHPCPPAQGEGQTVGALRMGAMAHTLTSPTQLRGTPMHPPHVLLSSCPFHTLTPSQIVHFHHRYESSTGRITADEGVQ